MVTVICLPGSYCLIPARLVRVNVAALALLVVATACLPAVLGRLRHPVVTEVPARAAALDGCELPRRELRRDAHLVLLDGIDRSLLHGGDLHLVVQALLLEHRRPLRVLLVLGDPLLHDLHLLLLEVNQVRENVRPLSQFLELGLRIGHLHLEVCPVLARVGRQVDVVPEEKLLAADLRPGDRGWGGHDDALALHHEVPPRCSFIHRADVTQLCGECP